MDSILSDLPNESQLEPADFINSSRTETMIHSVYLR